MVSGRSDYLEERTEGPCGDARCGFQNHPLHGAAEGSQRQVQQTVTLKLRASDFPTGVEEQNSWDKQTGDLEPQYVSEKMRIVEKEEHSLLLQDSREQIYYVSGAR